MSVQGMGGGRVNIFFGAAKLKGEASFSSEASGGRLEP